MKRINTVIAVVFVTSVLNTPLKGSVQDDLDRLFQPTEIQTAQQNPISQPAEIQDAQGNPVTPGSPPVFQPGQKNILIIHGWNQSPAGVSGLIDFAVSQRANVLVYQYPTGASITGTGLLLLNTLAMLVRPEVRFDILAYSQGGLVARVAKEPSALNGNRAFGDQVENLVTVATPHQGVDATGASVLLRLAGLVTPPESLVDMSVNSMFLQTLNASPRQGNTRYLTIAGGDSSHFRTNDGVVEIESAIGCDVLRTTSQAVLPLFHTPGVGTPAMPNHQTVYDQIRAWIFVGAPPRCVNLAGSWSVSEEGEVTCCFMGECETDDFSGSEIITIQDRGNCVFRYEIRDENGRLFGDRTLVVTGNQLTVSGIAAIPAPDVVVTENRFTGTGKVCGDTLTISGMGVFRGTLYGSPFSCTTTGIAEFTRIGSAGVSSATFVISHDGGGCSTRYGTMLTAASVAVPTGPM